MTETSYVDETTGEERREERQPVSRRGRRLLAAIIIVLLLALIGVTTLLAGMVAPTGGVADKDEADGVIWVRSIYGWGKGPSQQLSSPVGVSISGDGTIWVTDVAYKNVFAFNPEGKLVETRGTKTKERVIGLSPVVLGPDNAVFAGEPDMDRIRVWSENDEDLGSIPIPNPLSFAYRDGELVVGSRAGFAVVDANTGQAKKIVGTYGKGLDEFDTVKGVAIGDDGTIYACDTYNNRLVAYKKDGRRLWSVSTGAPSNKVNVKSAADVMASQETSAPAKLQLPGGVTIDGKGRVVVVDPFDFSFSVFDPKNGKFLAKYGSPGEKDGEFMYPAAISYDRERDWFAVADTGNHRVQLIRLPGSGNAFDPAAAARRTLTGPLRACFAPIILLIVMIVVFIVSRNRRKKKQRRPEAQPEAV